GAGVGGDAADSQAHEQQGVQDQHRQEGAALDLLRCVGLAHSSSPSALRCFTALAAKVGRTSRVKAVAVSRPPMTTVAKGFCTSAPAPWANAIGIKPTMATRAVVRTARS